MRIVIVIVLSLVVPFLPASAQHPTDLATDTAKQWLMLIDEEAYAASWNRASQAFKDRITQEKWVEAASVTRSPLGSVSTREVIAVSTTNSLPGLPDGDYTIIQFQMSFANKASAIETITLISDGMNLSVGGYFIQ